MGGQPVSRPPYDRWRDADGTHIPDHIPDRCLVEQIAVATEHGAVPSRLSNKARSPDAEATAFTCSSTARARSPASGLTCCAC
jgi:hypothetical protein